MSRLIVKNVGPIKSVDIELKKVNIFMGPQSCGKSTLAKIISFCTWMEKTNAFEEKMAWKDAYKRLQSYHKLSGSYFNEDSMIYYAGDNLTYAYNWNEAEAIPIPYRVEFESAHYNEKEFFFFPIEKKINPKVIYIPAERNFVSAVPNLRDYAEDNDNLLDFIKNWYDAKRKYPIDHKMDILNMGIEYYLGDGDTDVLQMRNGKKLMLRTASSGLQSIVPLILLIDWLSKGIYEEEKPYSYAEGEKIVKLLEKLDGDNRTSKEVEELKRRLAGFIQGKVYTHTQFVIEEPEQNLFPEAQRDLLFYLLTAINHGRNHRLVLTTHSPYILYALNNCLMAYRMKSEMPEEEYEELDCRNAALNPIDVAVWEIEDGKMRSDGNNPNGTIQDASGLIRANYFNRIMQGIMKDFNNMLNYYEEG